MSQLSMKKLYMLAMRWIAEKESQGLSREEAHRQVGMIADYLDFVWKNKDAAKKQVNQQTHIQSTQPVSSEK